MTLAEQHDALIEGEALTITWGLKQTKFFTLGFCDLTIAMDHKVLIKIFGDRTLDEISNTRLFCLKEKNASLVLQCHPPTGQINLCYHKSTSINGKNGIHNGCCNPTRHHCPHIHHKDQLAEETKKDADMLNLHEAIHCGFPDNAHHLPAVAQYWQYRDSLHESGGVVIYNDCAVKPCSL